MALEQFPFDEKDLYKGRHFTQAELTERFPDLDSMPPEKYQLELLKYKELLDKQLQKIKGVLAYVKIEGSGIKILTDAEATAYINRLQVRARRHMANNFLRLQNVDFSALSDHERQAHERRLIIESRYVQAQRQTDIDVKELSMPLTSPPLLEESLEEDGIAED